MCRKFILSRRASRAERWCRPCEWFIRARREWKRPVISSGPSSKDLSKAWTAGEWPMGRKHALILPRKADALLSVCVCLPGQRSIAVETTRLRGWFLEEHRAAGIGVWLRTKSGTGTAAFTLVANARSTNQIISRRAETMKVSTKWAKAALLFESFPKVRLGDLDLFSIEFAAEPGTELLIDDLHLLGRWRDDF